MIISYNCKVFAYNGGTLGKARLQHPEKDTARGYLDFLVDALEGTSQLFGTASVDGRILDCNTAFSELLGFSREEIRGLSWRDDLTPPEWHDVEARMLGELHRTKRPIRYEKEYLRKDGSRVPVELYVHLLCDENGDPLYYYAFVTDLTERKRLEGEKARTLHALGERVKELELLHRIAEILQREWAIPRILQEIVMILPAGWQYPDIMVARIKYGDDEFVTLNFRETVWRQGSVFTTDDGRRGVVEVFYLGVESAAGESPFLAEEQKLVDSIAEMLKSYLDRKRAEEALKQSEASLVRSQAIAHLGNWEVDVRTNIVRGSDELYQMVDLGPDLKLDAYIEKVHPEDRALVVESINAAIYGGKPFNIDWRIIPRPNEVRLVHAEGEVKCDENGDPIKFFGTVQDITEQKRTEEALRESEAGLAHAQRVAHLGSWSWDAERDVVRCSEELYRVFGMASRDFTFEQFFSLLHPGDRDRVREAVDAALYRGERYSPDYRVVWPDGSVRVVHAEGEVVFDGAGRLVRMFGTVQDVTEQRRVEERIAHVASFPELNPNPIFEVGIGGEIGYVNPSAGRLFPDLRVKGAGHPLLEGYESIVRDFVAGVKSSVARDVMVDSGYYHEIIYYVPDLGVARFYLIDITERKQAEEAIGVERRRLFDVLEALPAMICLLTPDYHVAFANRSFREKFGESHGRPCYEYCFGRTGPCEFCESYNVLKTGQPHHWEVTGPDGSVIDVHDFPFTDVDGSPMILEMDIDITERKRAEEALKLTQFSIDRASDMIFWVAPDGHFTYVNNAACRVLGYSREELLTMAVFDINTLHNKGNWQEHLRELKRRESITFENTFVAKDGRRIPVELSVNYLTFGGREYNCASVRDITERKRAEEELREAKLQAELYLDLMGHDINNMHQIALGYLELARDMPLDTGQKDMMDKPIEVLQRSAQLIQNVRKLQKLQEGLFRTEKVDILGVLTNVQREFGAVPNKAVRLNYNGDEHCYVMANELLHDVFSNLVSNAIKHTGDRADITVNLGSAEEGGKRYCRVSVEDDGPGIPDDFKGIIFNRVLKGTAKARGMGLGLYLVKSLVESYGGRVGVEDRVPGDYTKGARFVVMLPAV